MPPMCPSSPVKNLKPCQDLGSEELARTRGRPVFDSLPRAFSSPMCLFRVCIRVMVRDR